MSAVQERLTQIDEQARRAMEVVEADTTVSVVMSAVAKEFYRKSQKALGVLAAGDDKAIHAAVIEVEQAADSAKVAVEADPGATDETRQAVLAAHLSVCVLKSEL